MNKIILVFILSLVSLSFAQNQYNYWMYDQQSGLISEQKMSRQDIERNIYPGLLRWQEYFDDKSEKIKIDYWGYPLSDISADKVEECWNNAVNMWNSVVANSEEKPFL